MLKITEARKLELLGLATLGIGVRIQLNKIEKAINDIVEPEPESKYGSDAGGELVFNSGDDPGRAVELILQSWDVEVVEPVVCPCGCGNTVVE